MSRQQSWAYHPEVDRVVSCPHLLSENGSWSKLLTLVSKVFLLSATHTLSQIRSQINFNIFSFGFTDLSGYSIVLFWNYSFNLCLHVYTFYIVLTDDIFSIVGAYMINWDTAQSCIVTKPFLNLAVPHTTNLYLQLKGRHETCWRSAFLFWIVVRALWVRAAVNQPCKLGFGRPISFPASRVILNSLCVLSLCNMHDCSHARTRFQRQWLLKCVAGWQESIDTNSDIHVAVDKVCEHGC